MRSFGHFVPWLATLPGNTTPDRFLIPPSLAKDVISVLSRPCVATSLLYCEGRRIYEKRKCPGKSSGLGLCTSSIHKMGAIGKKSEKLEHASDRCSLYSHVIVANEGV